MSFAALFSSYLNLNLLLVIGYCGLWIFSRTLGALKLRIDQRSELQLHYSLLSFLLVLSGLQPLLPKHEVFAPAAKVWSAQSLRSFNSEYQRDNGKGYIRIATPVWNPSLSVNQLTYFWILLATLLFVISGLCLVRDLRSLTLLTRHSFLIRRIGNVRVYINSTTSVPFSYWLPYQANIVLPWQLLGNQKDFKIAIMHEIQHHRHGDTRWVYILWLLKLVCIANPTIYLWNRWIAEIQEFACDETLVDQGKVETQSYARCLIEVAQTAINQKPTSVSATRIKFLVESNLLKRRIDKMFNKDIYPVSKFVSVGVGLFIGLVMGTTAFAAREVVQDRRVSMAQARSMAARAQSDTSFPVVVNDLVLEQLNRFLGTPEGRMHMKESLARMENHKDVVNEYLLKYSVPIEIMAVPIIESGYQNLSEKANQSGSKAAGLWQFIPSTARNFGLVVDDNVDERLNVQLTTDAAIRYLQSNNLRFKDWHLSALAYNIGENAVQKAMDDLGTRDAWTLVRNGYEGDKNYLPKVVAAIIIMKNPESLN